MQLKFAQGINFKICTLLRKVQSYETEERERLWKMILALMRNVGN